MSKPMTTNEKWEVFERYRELVGDSNAIESLARAMGMNDLMACLEHIDRCEELNLFEESKS